MQEQLLLDIRFKLEQSFDTFVAGENTFLLEQLAQLQHIHPGILLWGAQGNGKSHLLNAAAMAFQRNFPESGIAFIPFHLQATQDFPVDIVQGLERCRLICLDNIDGVFGDSKWENALFHLFNRSVDSGTCLLVSMREPLNAQAIVLPDLRSRLGNLMNFELKPLSGDDAVKRIQLLARQRGIKLEGEVLNYIANRGPRDISALNHLLDTLDKESLKAKRSITVPFLKQFVEW